MVDDLKRMLDARGFQVVQIFIRCATVVQIRQVDLRFTENN